MKTFFAGLFILLSGTAACAQESGQAINAPDWCPAKVAENAFEGMGLEEAKQELEQAEGVEELRILTPEMAATMDFRVGRINVIHEDEVVLRTTCG